MIDHDRLVAGTPTPVLTTHIWMTPIVYPIFGAVLIAFIVAAACWPARTRVGAAIELG
jgi:hypothetical protein